MQNRPSVNKLGAFEVRLEEFLFFGKVGGGVYMVLEQNNILRTKHEKALETMLPGLDKTEIDGRVPTKEYFGDLIDFDLAQKEKGDGEEQKEEKVNQYFDNVTYVPLEPSRFGESDKEENNIFNHDHEAKDSAS